METILLYHMEKSQMGRHWQLDLGVGKGLLYGVGLKTLHWSFISALGLLWHILLRRAMINIL
jgi:hypothetical protein